MVEAQKKSGLGSFYVGENIDMPHLLEHIHPQTLVVNDPAHVRNAPEKLFVTHFPELMPPTLITSDRAEVMAFRDEHKDIIVKPLFGNGGAGVFHITPEDENLGSLLELFTANYSFMNEELARHYGIPGVAGPEFRKVQYPDDRRNGLLGHASVLTLTSHANRTSPVLRGKWVMEVLLGSPPPPPPPNVPDLDKSAEAVEGRLLTTRERMELHRSSASCRSCHQFIDPIGLALDNFDVTGRWRLRENGSPLDTRGDFYDGTPISTPAELKAVLLKRPIPLIRSFTQNLMAWALGRRIEYYDQPAIRRITAAAEAGGYRMNEFIIGVVLSDAFRMRRVADTQAAGSGQQ